MSVTVTVELNGVQVPLTLDDAALAVIRAATSSDQPSISPWLAGAAAAAEYLDWPVERVYKHVHALPRRRHGNRLIFHRAELDEWLDHHREE